MIRNFVFIIAIAIVMTGCSERYGGPIFPTPYIPDERPAVPSESHVVADIEDQFGDVLSTEIVSEVISVDSRIFIVVVENGTEAPTFFKVTYYLLDGEWVCIPEQIEM